MKREVFLLFVFGFGVCMVAGNAIFWVKHKSKSIVLNKKITSSEIGFIKDLRIPLPSIFGVVKVRKASRWFVVNQSKTQSW